MSHAVGLCGRACNRHPLASTGLHVCEFLGRRFGRNLAENGVCPPEHAGAAAAEAARNDRAGAGATVARPARTDATAGAQPGGLPGMAWRRSAVTFSAEDLREAGYEAGDLKSIGWTAKELRAGGYQLKSLRALGFPKWELRALT